MVAVIGRFSLGLVLVSVVGVAGVVEAGSLDLSESGMVRGSWDGLGDLSGEGDWQRERIEVSKPVVVEPVDNGGLLDLNDLILIGTGWNPVIYVPNFDGGYGILHTSSWGNLSISSNDVIWGNTSINYGGGYGTITINGKNGNQGFGSNLRTVEVDRIGLMDHAVSPVAPVKPTYTASMGVTHDGSGVERSLGGQTRSELAAGAGVSVVGHRYLSGDARRGLTGDFGSSGVVVDQDSGEFLVGSSGFVGLNAEFDRGTHRLGSEAVVIDLMSVDGRSRSTAGMNVNVGGWVKDLSSNVEVKSGAWGSYEFSSAGEIFGRVVLANKGEK